MSPPMNPPLRVRRGCRARCCSGSAPPPGCPRTGRRSTPQWRRAAGEENTVRQREQGRRRCDEKMGHARWRTGDEGERARASPAFAMKDPRVCSHLQIHVRVDRHEVPCGTRRAVSVVSARFSAMGSGIAASRWPGACGASALPLYSMPHFSLVMTGLPVRSLRKGFGLTGTCEAAEPRERCGVQHDGGHESRRAPSPC
eukprot:1235025-Prymnesium_polylepis.1